MKYFFISYALLLSSFYTHAQKSKYKLYHIQAAHGSFIDYNSYSGNQDVFQKLAPASELLQREYPGEQYKSNGIYIRQGGLSAGFIARKHLESTKRFVPVWRVGVAYQYGVFAYLNNFQETVFRIDSGVPPDSDQSVPVDSIFRESFNSAYNSNLLMVNLGLIWQQRNREKRWQWHGGFAVSGGYMFGSEMVSSYTEDHILVYHESPDRRINVFGGMDHEESENIPTNNGFALQAMMPIGVSLRIGNKESFFWRFQLFAEVAPGFQYLHLANAPRNIQFGIGQFAGIRYLL